MSEPLDLEPIRQRIAGLHPDTAQDRRALLAEVERLRKDLAEPERGPAVSPEQSEQLARMARDLSATSTVSFREALGALLTATDLLAEERRAGAEQGWDEGYAAGVTKATHRNPYRADQIAQDQP